MRQKELNNELKAKIKEDTESTELSKLQKSTEDKMSRLESQLKISRNNNRKLQNDNN